MCCGQVAFGQFAGRGKLRRAGSADASFPG